MPKPVRTAAVSAALLALTLVPGASGAAQAADGTGTTGAVQVDALRWVDGEPRLQTRTAANPAAARELAASMNAQPDVSGAQVRTEYDLAPVQGRALPTRTLLATDPYLSYAYHLNSIDAFGAWPTTEGDGITVAVLDSGVDASQPDIAGRVTDGGNFATGTDIGEHGTEVSTVLAGAYQNAYGAAGVAPDVDILAIRVCEPDGCSSDAIAEGILAAVSKGADVINMSLGGDGYNATMASAVKYAIAQGVVVVAAAGNSGDDGNAVEYPASFPGVVSVSASTKSGAAADWAQHNSFVDLSAPGDSIPVGEPLTSGTYPYAQASGTSFSTPQVAAAAALLKSVSPAATPAQVETWLKTTTTPQSSWGSGYGTGMLDVAAAVAAATAAGSGTAGSAGSTGTSPAAKPTPSAVTVTRSARTVRPNPVVRAS